MNTFWSVQSAASQKHSIVTMSGSMVVVLINTIPWVVTVAGITQILEPINKSWDCVQITTGSEPALSHSNTVVGSASMRKDRGC